MSVECRLWKTQNKIGFVKRTVYQVTKKLIFTSSAIQSQRNFVENTKFLFSLNLQSEDEEEKAAEEEDKDNSTE